MLNVDSISVNFKRDGLKIMKNIFGKIKMSLLSLSTIMGCAFLSYGVRAVHPYWGWYDDCCPNVTRVELCGKELYDNLPELAKAIMDPEKADDFIRENVLACACQDHDRYIQNAGLSYFYTDTKDYCYADKVFNRVRFYSKSYIEALKSRRCRWLDIVKSEFKRHSMFPDFMHYDFDNEPGKREFMERRENELILLMFGELFPTENTLIKFREAIFKFVDRIPNVTLDGGELWISIFDYSMLDYA